MKWVLLIRKPGEQRSNVKLNEDALEFLDINRVREIIKTHSDYVPFPIFIEGEKEQTNQQTAIWRENPRSVEDDQYQEFYRQLTLELEQPLEKIHFVADAPLMIYALLYLPAKPDRGLFTLREQDGLKLIRQKDINRGLFQRSAASLFQVHPGCC